MFYDKAKAKAEKAKGIEHRAQSRLGFLPGFNLISVF